MKERVCAVICNWNKQDDVVQCVDSVLKSSYPDLDVVVVDNASTDDSVKILKKTFDSKIKIIENTENLGGAGGFNTGLKYAISENKYQSVWLLDNDVKVDNSCLEALENPSIEIEYFTRNTDKIFPEKIRHRVTVKPLQEFGADLKGCEVLVFCKHILSEPNKNEKTFRDILKEKEAAVFYLDQYSNFYPGYSAMQKQRKTYNLGIKNPRYLTILRDPADKVISFYHHLRRDPLLWSMPRVREMSLEEYVTADFHRQGDNGQVRRLSGTTQLAVGEIGKQHAEKAKENLERWFSVVGLLERFDETLVLLKNQKVLTNLHYLKKNVAANRLPGNQVPKRVLGIIEKYNRWDMELYHFARELFEKKVARCHPGFAGEVETARRENQQYEEFYLNYTQGLELFENNQLEESKHCLNKCLESKKGMSEFPEIAAKIYFYLGEMAKHSDGKTWNTYFQKSLETALNKKYQTNEDIYLIASLFKRQGNYVESKKWFETLLVDSGFNDFIAGVYFHLGEIHLGVGSKRRSGSFI